MWFDERATNQSAVDGLAGALAEAEIRAGQAASGSQGGSGKADKKAAKKAEKEAKKAAAAAERAAKQAAQEKPDPLAHRYGDLPMIQSAEITERVWTPLSDIDTSFVGQEVLIRARAQNVRGKGKSAFLVLRQRTATAQGLMFVDDKTVSKGMVKYTCGLEKETVVEITGKVALPEVPLVSVTQSTVEIQITSIHALSRSMHLRLPLLIEDAARPEAMATGEDAMAVVSQSTRLDNRVLDLRTPANQAIFGIQSGVCMLFREKLLDLGFTEIHTPKMIAGASEGGAAVFKVDYMGRPACLAQSPQLYKQMAICADFERVFEIGPVFRAERSFTHRHLTEFTGLDMEMAIKEHYFEVLDVIEEFFKHIFDGLNKKFAKELEAVNAQYPFEPLLYPTPTLRLTFPEGVKLLHDAGYTHVDPLDDLGTEDEKMLGKLVREKYKTDFYILTRYPMNARPFYTMPAPDDPRYTNSYDVFIRGEEIISGAQRIHDAEFLEKRAVECGIDPETIRSYIESFTYGAPPHGGCGVGMERVVMLFLGLHNIRKSSMFPRDPTRLTP